MRAHTCTAAMTIFGLPFVKRLALSYRTVVCLSCLSVLCCLSCLCRWSIVASGWMDQDATWHGGRTRHRPHHILLVRDPASTKPHLPNFQPISIVAKRLDGSSCHSVRRYRPQPRRHCVRWRSSHPHHPKRGRNCSSPHFSPHVYCSQTVAHLSYC